MKYMTRKDWRNYVLGMPAKSFNASKSSTIIQGWIRAYMKEADKTIAALDLRLAPGQPNDHVEKLEMLRGRWRQIKDLCGQALKAVASSS